MQTETKTRVDKLRDSVTALRFKGDIASTSREAVLGAYQLIPKQEARVLLLDFSGVEYINSSGIAVIIQLLIEASGAGQKVLIFGLSPHFQKVFTMVGIPKYATLYADEPAALAAV